MPITELPRLYAILDGQAVRAAGFDLLDAAKALRNAGVRLVQYRDKAATRATILQTASAIGALFQGTGTALVLNDWPEIAVEAGWDGVHVGQRDASVSEARRLVGGNRIVGVSTHSPEQFRSALLTDADYLAYGPIFGTTTKPDAEATVGLGGLQEVRRLSQRPLVAIGGISLSRVGSVFAAGADSVAVVSALFQNGQSVVKTASDLLQASDLCR